VNPPGGRAPSGLLHSKFKRCPFWLVFSAIYCSASSLRCPLKLNQIGPRIDCNLSSRRSNMRCRAARLENGRFPGYNHPMVAEASKRRKS